MTPALNARLDELRLNAEAAWAKIGRDAKRLPELSDEDFKAVSDNAEVGFPLAQMALLTFCHGDVEEAQHVLDSVQKLPPARQAKLLTKVIREANHGRITARMLAAFVVEFAAGAHFCALERERRAAPMQ